MGQFSRCLLCAVWLLAWLAAGQEGTCDAKGGGKDCLVDKGALLDNITCTARGFDTLRLSCTTCRQLAKRLKESGSSIKELMSDCMSCCREPAAVERFSSARLIADANIQERDQDLHDFIKRKAPLFPKLEVEYMEAAEPAVEFEQEDDSNRILRAVVSGWKSEHLMAFLESRLDQKEEEQEPEGGGKLVAEGVHTAEIQTCSGCRLNHLPEVKTFVKTPGHADTYKGLKVNFIPGHNPDLVFFNEHGEEKERLDLGGYTTDQIHELMVSKGFARKKARSYKGEIRSCSGCRLHQLPELKRFITGRGNADAYIGIRINFVPHHHPYLIMYDEAGNEPPQSEWKDLQEYSFEDMVKLFDELGFKKKELM